MTPENGAWVNWSDDPYHVWTDDARPSQDPNLTDAERDKLIASEATE